VVDTIAPAIQTGVDAITFSVQLAINPVAALIQPAFNTIALVIQPFLNAVATIIPTIRRAGFSQSGTSGEGADYAGSYPVFRAHVLAPFAGFHDY